MSYNETLPYESYPPPDDDQETEVLGSEGMAGYPPPPPMDRQPPMRDYPPQPAGAARTEIMYKAPAVMAWLAVVSGPRTSKLHRLSPDVTTVGRDSHNDIIVDDGKVSRQHAKVKCEELSDDQHQFFIFDLATSNGTLVNGVEILKEPLYDGDKVQLGGTVLVFKQIDGPQRPSPEAEEEGEEEIAQEGD